MDPLSEFLALVGRLGDIGATGLLVVVVVMILTGRLVPRSVLQVWIDAYKTERASSVAKDATIDKFADAGRVTARALDAIPKSPDGGDSDVEEDTETRRRKRLG